MPAHEVSVGGHPTLHPPDARQGEPTIPIRDIQPNVLTPIPTHAQTYTFVHAATRADLHAWVSTTLETATPGTVNISFTHSGLMLLTPTAAGLTDVAFKQGLANRSRWLGDPTTPGEPGHPDTWVVGGPHTPVHALAVTAGHQHLHVPAGVTITHVEHCGDLPGQREHFGFKDPVSQPALRGRTPEGEFLHPTQPGARENEAFPGQTLIWPGEVLLGFPQQDRDDLCSPGPVAYGGPTWSTNGSYCVIRRLSQNPDAFENALENIRTQLAGIPELAHLSVDQIRAQLMGRWPNGASTVPHPVTEPEAPARHPSYEADRHGLACPTGAHVRKAFPRDHATTTDTVTNMHTHRLLRRGIPYTGMDGPGLMFTAYQTSFERQFEYVQRIWLNNPYLREPVDGHCPIAGQAPHAGATHSNRFTVFPYRDAEGNIQQARVDLPGQWVTPSGGDYFFTPSLTGLAELLHGDGNLKP